METNLFLKGVRVVEPGHENHNAVCHLHIAEGRVNLVPVVPDDAPNVWDGDNGRLCVSLGWWDGQVDFGEPGAEEREGMDTGLAAAAAGGVTNVVHVASTEPCVDSQADVNFLLQQAQRSPSPTQLHPLGTISRGRSGHVLSDMRELLAAGVAGFSEDGSVDSPELLRRALEYLQPMNPPVLAQPLESSLHRDPLMHESLTSTMMGLQGTPAEAETMRLKRDLDILRYTGGHLHFPVITTAAACEHIRAAKNEGLQVTCGTTAFHLLCTDEDLAGFDATLKVMPPFRTPKDRQALCEAVWDGTIDCVVSDHKPWNLERHDVEFMLVPFGMAGIEWTFPILNGALARFRPAAKEVERAEVIWRVLASGPRRVFGGGHSPQTMFSPSPGNLALTVFSMDGPWSPKRNSRAANQPSDDMAAEALGVPLGLITAKGALKLRPADR